MTATQTQIRRGTEAQCDAMTPAEGEVIADLTNDRLRLGDGLLAGGHKIPNATDIQRGSFNTVSASGTNTITVTLDPVPSAYFNNMTIVFKAAATNTTAVTLNVNSLGAKNIYKASGGALVALASGDLIIGAYYTVRYDGTQFVLEGSTGGVSSVTAADASLTISPTLGAVVAGINTNNSLGVGAYALCKCNTSSLANGATTAGSNIQVVSINYSSVWGNSSWSIGSSPSGTWRNVSGSSLNSGQIGMFIRTA